MIAPRFQRAKQLVTELRDVLDAAGLDNVMATMDAAHVPSGARHGIVVVTAPDLQFDGPFGQVQADFQLYVIAGPADDYLRAWERIDTITQALVDGHVNLRDGKPDAFGTANGDALPAYALTLNDLD